MKILLSTAAVLALLTCPAHAGSLVDLGNSNAQAQQQGQAQGQLQGQQQGQKQSNSNYNSDVNVVGQGQAQSADNQGNSQSVNFEDRRQAPAFGLGGLASGPCTGISGGFAVTTPLGGGGLSGATEDEECTKRETARVLFALGMTEEAKAVARTFGPLAAVREKQTAIKVSELPSIPPATASVQDQAVAMKLTASNINPATGKYDLACELGFMDCTKN